MTTCNVIVCYKRTKSRTSYRISNLRYDDETDQIGVYDWTDMLGHNQNFNFGCATDWEKNINSIVCEHYKKTGKLPSWRKVKSFIEKSGILERFYDWYLCNFAIATVPKEDVAEDFMLWCKGQYYKAVMDVPRQIEPFHP